MMSKSVKVFHFPSALEIILSLEECQFNEHIKVPFFEVWHLWTLNFRVTEVQC